MPDSFDYTTGTNSENVRLLQALIDDAPEYTEETNSRNANILKSIINNTEYTDAPQSEIEELLLRLKAKIGGEIEVDELTVTENGTYDAGVNKAYNPVNVELPLSSKTITENGTYQASDDNLAGYNEVTVAVEGYAKKSIANTPTPIATFNASALPMPSLKIGIEPVQSGSGDPSPENERPISGWSAVNVYDTGKNLADIGTTTFTRYKTVNIRLVPNTYTISATVTSADTDANTCLITPLDGDGNIISTLQIARDTRASVTFTSAIPISSIRFYSSDTSAHAQGDSATFTDVQIEIGDTPTEYTPYNGTTTPIQFVVNGETKTIYSGYVEIKNGKVKAVADRAEVDLGTLNYSKSTSGLFQTSAVANDIKRPISTASPTDYIISSIFKEISGSSITGPSGANPSPDGVMGMSSTGIIYFNYLATADIDEFKQAMNGVQLVYTLATPIEYDLADVSISTQEGTNNLWADTGDVQSGEYLEAL